MADAFFEPDGERFVAAEHTRGPWSNDHQHAGPPAALLARAYEGLAEGMSIVRMTFELLKPVPIAALTVDTETLREGRRVRQLGATLRSDGEAVVRSSAVLIRSTTVTFDPPPRRRKEPEVVSAEDSAPTQFPFFRDPVGYHTAMELRIGRGGIGEGHAMAWLRMRHPLVAGETPTPLQRLAIAADSGNGVSAALDHARYVFINPDLTVYIHRLPEGEWIGLDAQTHVSSDGYGLADDRMHDQRGPVARAAQSLLVAPV